MEIALGSDKVEISLAAYFAEMRERFLVEKMPEGLEPTKFRVARCIHAGLTEEHRAGYPSAHDVLADMSELQMMAAVSAISLATDLLDHAREAALDEWERRLKKREAELGEKK